MRAPVAGFGPPSNSRVLANAMDASAVVELEQLGPPYQRWSSGPELDEEVPPGYYRVRFRVGSEVFSQTDVELVSGAEVQVTPTVAASPLILEALGLAEAPRDAVISESIGPIQAALQPTLLAIIGIKPFDTNGELFHQFEGLVARQNPLDFADRPVSVVVAIDGNGWPTGVDALVRSLDWQLTQFGETNPPLALTALGSSPDGFGRIVVGYAPAPLGSFSIVLKSPFFGRIELASAGLDRRATVVTVTLRPDGTLDVTQNLLRMPGYMYGEPVPSVTYGRMLRDLQLGQRLYQNNELIERGSLSSPDTTVIRELLQAKWTDPILGCMAYYAWGDAAERGLPAAQGVMPTNLEVTAGNLEHYFPVLPDSPVIAALTFPHRRDKLISDLLDREVIPVLARSTRELARFARARGQDAHPIVQRAARLDPSTPWTLAWDVEPTALHV